MSWVECPVAELPPRARPAARHRQGGVYTTGDVARLFAVAPRTVAKWFDSGRLSGYRIPGGLDRRFRRADMLAFCAREGVPVPPGLAADGPAVLLCLPEPQLADAFAVLAAGRVDVRVAADVFHAGLLAAARPFSLALVDRHGADREAARAILRGVRGLWPGAAVGVVLAEDDRPGEWAAAGFGPLFQRPVAAALVAATVARFTQGGVAC